MGGGFLPVTLHHGELYFLFGRENEFADTPGFSDFGGGQDGSEASITTALREFVEETSGFMGNSAFIRDHLGKCGLPISNLMSFQLPLSSSKTSFRLLKKAKKHKRQQTFSKVPIDKREKKKKYQMFLFPMLYSDDLPTYFNHMQEFLRRKLSSHLRRNSKIFEKDYMQWFSWNELQSAKVQAKFRTYFQKMIQHLVSSSSTKEKIKKYVSNALQKFSSKSKIKENIQN